MAVKYNDFSYDCILIDCDGRIYLISDGEYTYQHKRWIIHTPTLNVFIENRIQDGVLQYDYYHLDGLRLELWSVRYYGCSISIPSNQITVQRVGS